MGRNWGRWSVGGEAVAGTGSDGSVASIGGPDHASPRPCSSLPATDAPVHTAHRARGLWRKVQMGGEGPSPPMQKLQAWRDSGQLLLLQSSVPHDWLLPQCQAAVRGPTGDGSRSFC